MNKKKISLSIVLILFALILLFIKYSDVKLAKEGVLLNARTTEWKTSSYMGLELSFEFYYNGKKMFGSNAFNDFRGNDAFVNRYFPVMYEPKLGSSKLLIEPLDFKKIDLPFPDSLKWVLGYLK